MTGEDWEKNIKILNRRKRIIKISEIIDRTLFEWYSSRGREVPNWKLKNNQEWWINYLDELEKNE